MEKLVIESTLVPSAVGSYSQGIKIGSLVFTSGQLPISPDTGICNEGGIEEQTHQVMQNIKNIVEAAGSDMAKIVKTTVYLSDITNFKAFDTVYRQYFLSGYPARSCVEVAAIPKGALVEIEAIAAL